MPRALAAVFAAAALLVSVGAVSHASASTPTPKPGRGVVIVTTNLAYQNGSAAGTGIVLGASGRILTNNHVIRGATTIDVRVPGGRTYPADVLGYDLTHDVALLQLRGASGLATATRGNSATVKVGQKARAVGNAQGRGRLVVSSGRITGLHRTITVNEDDGSSAQLGDLLETSASLVPGDSGGPLLDARGRVVGMDTAGSPTFAFQSSGDGFAIPINRALTIAGQIAAGRQSATVHVGAAGFLGIQAGDAPNGVSVGAVIPGSPAAAAGLQQGDVITTLNGKQVGSFTDLQTSLFPKHPGDTIALAWLDPLGNQGSANVTLASGPPPDLLGQGAGGLRRADR